MKLILSPGVTADKCDSRPVELFMQATVDVHME